MKPRLRILDGSKSSPIFELKDIEMITIGRSPANDLVLAGNGISRSHIRIIRTETGNFKVEDLKSRNGTFINELKVKEVELRHGDHIVIGDAELIFLTEETDETTQFSEEFVFIEDMLTESTIEFPMGGPSAQLPTDLNILTKIGEVLNSTASFEGLQQKLIEIILEIIPAERAAIILLNQDFTSPNSVSILDKKRIGNRTMQISRKVSQQILSQKAPVLMNNISQNEFETAESLLDHGINSVLGVPLLLGEITGLIYLDSRDITFKFEEYHLQQMTAIANLVAAALKNLLYMQSLKVENESLQNFAKIESNMIGESHLMKLLIQMVAKVSPIDSTVLITGASGTGKELVARAIHKNSLRNNKPLTVVNCALLNENLLESDLFGHEKGAFTGAIGLRKGKLELAEGGTLFLDEIGELPIQLQVKLLRFLQEREFERVGSSKIMKADVRIIAATNRNLLEEIKKGQFREDLYFRLRVVELQTPLLNKRKVDIPLLTKHFIEKHSERCKRRVQGISRKALTALMNYDWRGNVRELENAIERAVALGLSDTIQLEDLPYEVIERKVPEDGSNFGLHELVKEAKRKIILSTIKDANKNYSEAARQLKVHPNNLQRIMRELGIKEKSKI